MSDSESLPDPSVAPEKRARARGRGLLSVALVLSLGLNGFLIVGMRSARDDAARQKSRAGMLSTEAARLRETLRGNDRTDPLARIAGAVERLRALTFTRDVRVDLLPAATFATRVMRQFERDDPRAQIESTRKTLVALGLLEPRVDLYALLRRLQEEQIAGFYDNKTKRMVVGASGSGSPSPLDRVFLAHEYVHALTDQHWDLGALDRLQKQRKDDEAMAYLSVAEGDATLTMKLYQEQVLTAAERRTLAEQAGAQSSDVLDSAPQFLQETLEFPYVQGLQFVKALYDRGGFTLVDRAYRDPPRSTEQILHPGRYLDRRDDPVAVALPDVRATLGGKWSRTDGGDMGELDLRETLDHGGAGLSLSDSSDAANGWDGGRYVTLSSSDGVTLAALTVWDSESEARQAERAFARWLPLRYRNRGAEFDVNGEGRGWESPDGAGIVLRAGTRMLLVLAPNAADARVARTAFDGF